MRLYPAATLALCLAAASLAGCASPAASWSAAPAAAPDVITGNFGNQGLYVGAYGFQAYEQFDDIPSGVDTSDSDLGLGVKLGFRLAERFAVEGFIESVDGFDIEAGALEDDLELLNLGVMGKMFFLTDSRVQPWIAGGIGAVDADAGDFDEDHGGGFVRVAGGVDVWVTERLGVFGELNYSVLTGGVKDFDHMDLQLGVIFHF